jgi:hypothetical protein
MVEPQGKKAEYVLKNIAQLITYQENGKQCIINNTPLPCKK